MDRSLGRTIKSNFAFYETDGLGRDGYISYNNGGFWKDNLKFAVNKPKYDYPHYSNFRSLTRFPAPFKYYSDGSGRDTYIIYNEGGLVKGFTPYNAMNLSNYLRHYENVSGCCSPSRGKKPFLSQSEIKTQTLLGRIQKNVVGRLYDKEKQKFLPHLKKKLQMRNINMFYLDVPTKHGIKKEVVYNVDDDNWESEKLCENDYLNSLNIYNNGRDRFLSYPWGVWVTAYARRILWTGILAFGRDYVYSDTDSIKAINFDKHLDYIEKYNQVVEMKLRKMCEFRKIDFELCRPKNIKGETKLLGAWEYETKDNKYIKFKTLGTKKYMYLDNEGLHITVAGLSKSVGVEYILNKCNNDYAKCFEFFNNDMYIPPEHSGKLQHTYIDDEFETEITDYLGHKTTVKSLSYVHLEKCDFSLNKSHRYGKILNMLMNGYVYKGVKTK